MGSRSPQAVKEEIVQIRGGLDEKLDELEQRLPPLVATAKKVAIGLAGGGGGGLLLFVLRKVRSMSRKRADKGPKGDAVPGVQLLPKSAVPVAMLIAAIWAGVRLYEAHLRTREAGGQGPAVLPRLRETRSAS